MKPIIKNSSLILVLFVFLYTCVSDKEEQPAAPEQEEQQTEKTNAVALSEWKKFNATADKLVRITATNLKSLSVAAKKTPIAAEKESLLLIYHQSEKDYKALKARLALQNKMFQEDIDSNTLKSEEDYRVFKNLFINDILELNNNLEDILEELQ